MFMRYVWKDLLLLTLLLSVLFGFMLGTRPFSTPDEGRYVEIPREMVDSGDYMTPRLNGVLYFEKPVLFYWAQALMIKIFGLSEGAMRLLPAFIGLLGCLVIYAAGHFLWGRGEGLLSAGILGTSVLYYAHTRIIILDLMVSFFIALSLLSFLKGIDLPPSPKRRFYGWLFFVACAGATLTKGLIGLCIPGGVILFWMLLYKRWDVLKFVFAPGGILLYLALAAPWHILVSLKNPSFPYFYFVHEHFIRFLQDAHGRTQSFFFFVPVLLLGFFPWIFFLFQAGHHILKERGARFQQEVFLLLWIGVTFVFFSLGKSKLIPYILPLWPALALITGKYIFSVWGKKSLPSGFKTGIRLYGIFCVVLIGGVWGASWYHEALNQKGFMPYILFISFLLCVCAASVFFLRERPREQVIALFLTTSLFLSTVNAAWPYFDRPSIKPLALKLLSLKKPLDEVVCYHRYYQDLPVYLGQKVKVVSWDGELNFGMRQEDTTAWMLNDGAFWTLWEGEKRVFTLMRKEAYANLQKTAHKNLYFVMEFGRDVLLTNQKKEGDVIP